ncbi:MAG: DUF58 domain-containing protein [Methylococcales bacterium]|nr:DUF58 domain-containing protein [Methylococcales bacterium]
MGHLCLIILLIAGVFGVDTKASSTYQLFMFLSIVFIFSFLSSLFNRFKCSIKRQLPRYATVGDPLVYSVTLSNQSKKNYYDLAYIEQLTEVFPNYSELINFYKRQNKPWYKKLISFRLWRRYLAFLKGSYIDEQAVTFLGVEQAAHIKVTCTPLRRGKLHFSGAYIAKADLLGLFRRLYFSAETEICLVLPKRYEIPALNLSGKRQYQLGGMSLANSVGDSSEFMSLREYRQGDALNQIHWKSFARHGKLIVKEYQDEYFVRRALLLDTDVGELNNDSFEAAVSVAASLAISERQNEALLDLMFVGRESYRFTTGRGIDHMPHLQEILAAVQPSDSQSFARLKQAVIAHVQQCSSLVCVLLHWDKERQLFFQSLTAQAIPLAVFLIHDGSLKKELLENKPEHFYLIDSHQLAEDLAGL